MAWNVISYGQVDTSFVYNTSMPYGTLDIRLAKSSTRYYYLQPGKTFSFRESAPGVKTNSFHDMTNWDSSPYTEGNMREKNGSNDYYVMNYRLLFPQNYNANFAAGYPLIVMMHGLGERGNCWDTKCYHADKNWNATANSPAAPNTATHPLLNNDHNLLHGGKQHLEARNKAGNKQPNDPTLPEWSFPGIVLFPQNMNGWTGSSVHDALRMIRLVIKKYNVDPDRVYIHGLSNGGYGVYEAIKRAPWLFAAALPMSAVSDASINSQGLAPSIARIPLWIFQGGQDLDPKPSKTEGFIRKFRDAGAVVRYTKYDHLGHGVWNTAYKEPDFFSWMLSKRRNNLHAFAGVPNICTTNGQGARLSMPEGFRKYQWELNGSVISGATSASYVATTAGTYRGRYSSLTNPSSSDWYPWSAPVTVTAQAPPKPVLVQGGTMILRDLNRANNAYLSSATKFEYYYWYKDGVKQNLADTVRFAMFKAGDCSSVPCVGNGLYTLRVANLDGCPSPPSDAKSIIFNDQAPENLSAATNFRSTGTTPSSVSLAWTDAASGEIAYEIWRRKVTGPSTFSTWSMAGITNANATSFTDTGLEPSTNYQYKVRAVSGTGRSNYTPSSTNSTLEVVTQGDTSPPTKPSNVVAAQSGIGRIKVTWSAATDNTGIQEYIITHTTGSTSVSVPTGSPLTTYELTGLSINKTYSITVRARDFGGNLGSNSSAASADTYVNGLYYEHTTGAWSDLDDINWSTYEYSGTIKSFALSPKVQDDYFNFKFDGYVYIQTPGNYYFSTSSNEGSRLELKGSIIVDNDGIHGTRTRESTVQNLTSGGHRISVKYFEYDGGEILRVSYKGPDTGNEWVYIPESALKSGNTSAASVGEPIILVELEQEDPLSVWPNPTTQHDINVRFDNVTDGEVGVGLMDLNGRAIYSGVFQGKDVREGIRIQPTHALQAGIYVVTVQDGVRIHKKKLALND